MKTKNDDRMQRLRLHYDELRIKAELGKMDAKDVWRDIEAKFSRAEAELKKGAKSAAETATAKTVEYMDDIESMINDLKHKVVEKSPATSTPKAKRSSV